MNIEMCTIEDIQEIRKLWKQGKQDLGIPFTNELQSLINNNCFFCTKNQSNEIISFCGYKIMKRKPEIRICHLLVHKDERNKHIAIKHIKHIVKETAHGTFKLTINRTL